MATSNVKITQLSSIAALDANTANTLFVAVDIPTGTTYKTTATAVANGLYTIVPLNVGGRAIALPGVVGQFTGNSATYMQINFQNFNANGSSDIILTADTGNDVSNYLDLGINNSDFDDVSGIFSAIGNTDGYLYVQGTSNVSKNGNLVIGTASAGANIYFTIGGLQKGNIVAAITPVGLVLKRSSANIVFSDGSVQYTAAIANTANSATSGNLFVKGTLFTNTISTIESGAPLIIDPAGSGSLIIADRTQVLIKNTSPSTSNSTGALTISGGLGVSGNIYVNNGQIISSNGFYAQNTYTGSYSDGVILDYTAGMGRISIGSNDGLTIYNGGLALKPLFSIAASGNVIVGNTSSLPVDQSSLTVYTTRSGLPEESGGLSSNTSCRILVGNTALDFGGTSNGATWIQNRLFNDFSIENDLLLQPVGGRVGVNKKTALTANLDVVGTANISSYVNLNNIVYVNSTTPSVNSNTGALVIGVGGFGVTGNVNIQGNTYVQGLLYTKRGLFQNTNVAYATANTQQTLFVDFANCSLYKANSSNGLSITVGGFFPGKVAEIFYTNSNTVPQNVLFGIANTNIATGNTANTYAIQVSALTTAYIKYACFGTEISNVFVTATFR